jgi:transposase-like protein
MEGDTEFWTSHVAACCREGIAASVYASRHGLTLASLYYWRRKLPPPRGTRKAIQLASSSRCASWMRRRMGQPASAP